MAGGSPYTVRLDAESARELAQRGGTILLLDVPESTAVGVDQQVGARRAAHSHPWARAPLPPPPPPPLSVACCHQQQFSSYHPTSQTFLVGPKFKGVKMVPPGTHLISYSAASGQGDFGPTTAFFLPIKSGQVRGYASPRARGKPATAT